MTDAEKALLGWIDGEMVALPEYHARETAGVVDDEAYKAAQCAVTELAALVTQRAEMAIRALIAEATVVYERGRDE